MWSDGKYAMVSEGKRDTMWTVPHIHVHVVSMIMVCSFQILCHIDLHAWCEQHFSMPSWCHDILWYHSYHARMSICCSWDKHLLLGYCNMVCFMGLGMITEHGGTHVPYPHTCYHFRFVCTIVHTFPCELLPSHHLQNLWWCNCLCCSWNHSSVIGCCPWPTTRVGFTQHESKSCFGL